MTDQAATKVLLEDTLHRLMCAWILAGRAVDYVRPREAGMGRSGSSACSRPPLPVEMLSVMTDSLACVRELGSNAVTDLPHIHNPYPRSIQEWVTWLGTHSREVAALPWIDDLIDGLDAVGDCLRVAAVSRLGELAGVAPDHSPTTTKIVPIATAVRMVRVRGHQLTAATVRSWLHRGKLTSCGKSHDGRHMVDFFEVARLVKGASTSENAWVDESGDAVP